MILLTSQIRCRQAKILSLKQVGQKRKMVVKIEFTPLSLDRKIFPFKKGFKKNISYPSKELQQKESRDKETCYRLVQEEEEKEVITSF